MQKYQGVLFDYDGVIADTVGDNFRAWKKAFGQSGIKIKRGDYFPLEGLGPNDIALQILKSYDYDSNLSEHIAQAKAEYYKDITKRKGIKVYPYVTKILRFLARMKIQRALVTGAKRERVEDSIPEMIGLFGYIVAGYDKLDGKEIKGKPAPDPYLLAAKKLDLDSKACVVVENATIGIKSAQAAGCYCIALTTTLNKNKLQVADKIFNNHKELFDYFRHIF